MKSFKQLKKGDKIKILTRHYDNVKTQDRNAQKGP